MMTAETVTAEAYRQLRERYEAVEEMLRQERALRQGIIVQGPRWPSLMLSPSENRVVDALYDNKGIVARDYLASVACKDVGRCEDPPGVLRVLIARIRGKTLKHGVSIRCVNGYGYELPDAAREALAKIEQADARR